MQAVGIAMSADQQTAGVPQGSGMARKVAIIAGLSSLCLAGFAVAVILTGSYPLQIRVSSSGGDSQAAAATAPQQWAASAPGRVEPRSGLIRLAASLPGKVEHVAVNMNDKVAEGEVLVQLEDKEARARLTAAEARERTLKKDRDAVAIPAGRESVSKAEDAVFNAERAVKDARLDLDGAIANNRKNASNPNALVNARRRLADANDKLRQEQVAFATAQSKGGVPPPNALESALTAARSEVTVAEMVLLDRTRVRAPIAGTVLQVNARLGELAAPSVEAPLVVMGDMSIVRVRAEVDEADVNKIKKDQRAFVKNTAYPNKEYDGKVVELSPSLALPRMGSRGARRATDVEVMEVLIDLEGSVPLLPGMRVDVFFRR